MTAEIIRRRPAPGALTVIPVEPGCSKELIAAFLARYGTPKSRYSVLCALRLAARVLGSRPEDIRWWELTPTHMVGLKLALTQRMALSTARHALVITRGLLKECWRQGVLDSEALARLTDTGPVRGARVKRRRMLDLVEIQAVLAVLEQCSHVFEGARAGAIFALGYGCGLRRNEIATVKLEWLGLDAGEITVVGKGNKQRLMPIPEVARRLLRVWLQRRGARPGRLICTLRGAPLTGGQLARELGKLLESAKITDIRPHDLRRTYASGLLAQGVDLATVQALLGHDDPRTTAGYDSRPAATRAQAVRKLPGLGDS